MRLINARTLAMEEFPHESAPPYAVLSHTWGDDQDEMTLRDMLEKVDKYGNGTFKIQKCCAQALQDGLSYVWIDTCCIDKTNAVELSEAINSMFRWYRHAAVCYAYLVDVLSNEDPRQLESSFASSRWFQRGWTLQELLAPRIVRFYSAHWQDLGTKVDNCVMIETITGIPPRFLLALTDLGEASIAQRMSWAAKRTTKRKEDLAYCLLGLFEVSIPLIYGEGGARAFLRLQEEIMKRIHDDSILAWGISKAPPADTAFSKPEIIVPGVLPTNGRILATEPGDFAGCGDIVRRNFVEIPPDSLEMARGRVRLHLPLFETAQGKVGLLNCGPEGDADQSVGIPLAACSSNWDGEYYRPKWRHWGLQRMAQKNCPLTLIYVQDGREDDYTTKISHQYWSYGPDIQKLDLELIEVVPSNLWDKHQSFIMSSITRPHEEIRPTFARLRQKGGARADFVAAIGAKYFETNVLGECHLMICQRGTSLDAVAEGYQHMRLRSKKGETASNGLLNLQLSWSQVPRRPVFRLMPASSPNPPDRTFDATMELEKLAKAQHIEKVVESNRENIARLKKTKDRIHRYNTCRTALKERKQKVENTIAKLEKDLLSITDMEIDMDREMEQLRCEEDRMKERGETLLQEMQDLYRDGIFKTSLDDDYFGQSFFNLVDTLFHQAVRKGYKALVEELHGVILSCPFSNDRDYEDRNDQRTTALHIASDNGHADIVHFLLSKNYDPEAMDKDTLRPIHLAALKGQTDVMACLLAMCEVDSTTWENVSALHMAIDQGHEAAVLLLLERGADMDHYPILSMAVEKGNEKILGHLLSHKANMNSSSAAYNMELCTAIRTKQQNIVAKLIEYSADITMEDLPNQSFLHLAVESGCEGIVALLVERGANIAARSVEGKTPVQLAAARGEAAIFDYLVEAGADIETRRSGEWTMLEYATLEGHEAIVTRILALGEHSYYIGRPTCHAIDIAVERGHWSILKLLENFKE